MYVTPCESHSRFAVCLINSDNEEHAVYTVSWFCIGRGWRWMQKWRQMIKQKRVKALLPSLVRRIFRWALICRTSLNTLWACSVCRRWCQRNCSASQKISEWLWGKDTTPLSRLSSSPTNERRLYSVRVLGVRMCIRCRTEMSVKGVHLYVLVVGGNRHKLRQPLAEPHGHVTVHVHSKRFKAFLQATDGEVLQGADVLTKVHSGNLTNTQTAHWDETWRWTSSVERCEDSKR